MSKKKWRLLVAAAVLAVAGAVSFLLLAATPEEEGLSAQDIEQMTAAVGDMQAAKVAVWPVEQIGSANLPDRVKKSVRDKRVQNLQRVLTPRFRDVESQYDPVGTLEELRNQYSEVVIDAGYEVRDVRFVATQDDGSVIVDADVWAFSESASVSPSGKLSNRTTTDAVRTFRYVFRLVDGTWLIDSESMITAPLDPDPGAVDK